HLPERLLPVIVLLHKQIHTETLEGRNSPVLRAQLMEQRDHQTSLVVIHGVAHACVERPSSPTATNWLMKRKNSKENPQTQTAVRCSAWLGQSFLMTHSQNLRVVLCNFGDGNASKHAR